MELLLLFTNRNCFNMNATCRIVLYAVELVPLWAVENLVSNALI